MKKYNFSRLRFRKAEPKNVNSNTEKQTENTNESTENVKPEEKSIESTRHTTGSHTIEKPATVKIDIPKRAPITKEEKQ